MPHIIEITDLCYSYPDGRQALHHINLSVAPGEKVALVGSNGAGKSTLLLHFNGILQGSGSVHINGLEIKKENLERIRSLVGLVFQNPDDQLFSATVMEDVAFGPIYQGLPKAEVEQSARQALRSVHMEENADRSPYHLSGGEKKRVAIATVLSMNPQILVFDEPTAGLDPRTRRELIELLEKLPQTLIIATHDLDLVRRLTPRMVILNQGKITADGVSSELLDDRKLLFNNGLV